MTTNIAAYHLFNGSTVHDSKKHSVEQGLPPIRSILQDISFNDLHHHQQQHSHSFFTTSQTPHNSVLPTSYSSTKLPLLIPSASIQPIPQPHTSPHLISNSTVPIQQISSPLSSDLTRSAHSSSTSSTSSSSSSIVSLKASKSPLLVDKSMKIKKKYECSICTKNFTTSGHLARHTRIHTGERNHTCPFEGCGAKFSRQDNCMQHFRTHSSKGSRKKSKSGVFSKKS